MSARCNPPLMDSQALGRWPRGDCLACMRPAPLSHILAGRGAAIPDAKRNRGPGVASCFFDFLGSGCRMRQIKRLHIRAVMIL